MTVFLALLAAFTIWDYPARQIAHERLKECFVAAMRAGEPDKMEEACRQGVNLLPSDPTWRYNLACSLAYFPKRADEAFQTLEKAIDLGFRDVALLEADNDLKRLSSDRRYSQLIEYAREMQSRPILFGPLATVDATGLFGTSVALGEQNLSWDFDVGCFVAHLKLATVTYQPWTGDLYMNRDQNHSRIDVAAFPGLTELRLDKDGRDREMDANFPNLIVPYPVFGNCSRAFVGNSFWRSLPRALTTTDSPRHLRTMERLYRSNQIWVFPSNADTPPVGTNGDVFASITPYCITTAGRSWSDIPYLKAALLASAALKRPVKDAIVRRGLLSPTIQTLMRKSLGIVSSEDEYTSPRAHPTAFPPNAVNTNRLAAAAAALEIEEIPPLSPILVELQPPKASTDCPELTYRTPFAWAFVLRADDLERVFVIRAVGAQEFRFVQTHGKNVVVKIDQFAPDRARVTVNREGMTPINRVDIAVFGRNPGTGWGAPSYVSIARMDPAAPYSDPILTPRPKPSAR